MKSNLATVIELVGHLSKEDMIRARDRINLRLGLDIAVNGKATGDSIMVQSLLGVVADECKRLGLDRTSPAALSKGEGLKTFKEKVEGDGLAKFLQDATSDKVQLLALARVGVNLLIKDLMDMRIAISARTVMNHMHRLPAVLNKAFPGYAASGYAHLIVQPVSA